MPSDRAVKFWEAERAWHGRLNELFGADVVKKTINITTKRDGTTRIVVQTSVVVKGEVADGG